MDNCDVRRSCFIVIGSISLLLLWLCFFMDQCWSLVSFYAFVCNF